MPKAKWEFLERLPFGIIIFASPSIWAEDTRPLPVRIDSDLDGDRYIAIWDKTLLDYMENFEVVYDQSLDDDDPLINAEFTVASKDAKKERKASVISKIRGGDTPVYAIHVENEGYRKMSRAEITIGRGFVHTILEHRGTGRTTEFNVQYLDGSTAWKRVTLFERSNYQDALECYVEKSDASFQELGLGWLEKKIHDSFVVEIQAHQKVGQSWRIKILWDDGDTEWKRVDWLKDHPEDVEKLVVYVRSLPKQRQEQLMRNAEWKWVRKHLDEYTENWLERGQTIMSDLALHRDHANLKKKLHGAWKRQVATNDGVGLMENHASTLLGRAYKKSNDLMKHGGNLNLPPYLHSRVKDKSIQKYLY